MHSFQELSQLFEEKFNIRHFPNAPVSLYDPSQYILSLGGKRIRPVMCLMGNELVSNINPDTWHVATAIELFHNFTLIHDDIMDKAPLRRGMETVHNKFGDSTALLAGDVMLVVAYDYVNKINKDCLQKVMRLFNKTAKEVCEGQQLDMDFEKKEKVSFDEYLTMIELKTSVALAASLQLGAILGGAGEGNQKHLYEFGRNLGIAFQIQDDYLDAFGDPEKFGKQVGGDILSDKKTFLSIHAMEVATAKQLKELENIHKGDNKSKIAKVLKIYKDTNVDAWAKELKDKYYKVAMHHLEEIAVLSARKKPLMELAEYLINREH
ncbi:MAG TPA: polyprenyl synthetase family protein [Chitinophagaceae bacterium]|nr:polyprenyl synthetase family protein [Chitinophagaceae bacterium]